MIERDGCIRRTAKVCQKGRRWFDSTNNRPRALAVHVFDWLKDVYDAGPMVRARELPRGSIYGCTKFRRELDRSLYLKLTIRGEFSVRISLEQSEPGEIVGLTLK